MRRSTIPPTVRVAIALFIAIAAPGEGIAAQAQNQAPLEVLYGFTLIDGRGGPPIEDAALAIRGNEILTVSSRRELLSGPNAPRDAIVRDLGGGYVIPGLIDSHVHLATVPNHERAEAELYRLLFAGVTAVRDMAGDARTLASIARDTRLGQLDGPDVYFSALMAGPSFFSDPRPQSSALGETAGEVAWMQAITPETDLVTAVARAKGTYATGIKIYANLSATEVANITAEGHRQGMQVWAHSMVFPARPLEVVNAGVDVISHVCRIAWEGMAAAPTEYHHDQVPEYGNFSAESPIFTEVFERMLANGTTLDATLAMYSRMEHDPSNPRSDECDVDFAQALVRRAHEMGVPIIAGTDFTTPSDDPYPALLTELEELVANGGLTPMEAIQSATSVAANAIGIGDRHGVLEHGRPVTFVLLQSNPLEDIGNLRTVRSVWKNAERFDRSAYRRPVADSEATTVATSGPQSPQEALEAWLGLWHSYDLDALGDVYLQDRTLTYYGSDSGEVKEGFDAVRAYFEQQGFVSGGFQPENDLWLENTLIARFDDSAVVTADWYFGNRVLRDEARHGPLTLVIIRTRAGYRVAHVNMGAYAPGS